jgi:hypothetical protein
MRVARYYCRKGHKTFSLLPDCMSSRLSSSLTEVEQVVVAAEQAPTLEQAAQKIRPDIDLQGAIRWVRRRVQAVQVALLAIATLWPAVFGVGSRVPTLTAFQSLLETRPVLMGLRPRVAMRLQSLPPPLGFGPRTAWRGPRRPWLQHQTGPDPPGDRR